MKHKILNNYNNLCIQYKQKPKSQIVTYLEEGEELNQQGEEVINLIYPGNTPENFNNRLISEDLHPLMSSHLTLATNIRHVNLDYNRLDQKSCIYLSKLLEFAENIISLSLMGNQIDDQGCEKLTKNLIGKVYLNSLNMNSNQIGNIGVIYITELLYTNPSLVKLDLGHNQYDWDGIIGITTALKEKNSIQVLNLDSPMYKIPDQDFFTHFGKMFLLNKGVKKISLRFHQLRAEGCNILFHNLKFNYYLTVLDLTGNQICFQGVQYISKYLEITKYLKSIILTGNSIHDQGAKILAYGISKNMSVVHLDLTNNGIHDLGLCRLAEGLNDNMSIKSLKLFRDNVWGQESINLFRELLKIKGDDFYPDFVIYEDLKNYVEIAYEENNIRNQEDVLVV